VEHAVIPLAEAFAPQALVITCGVDGLEAIRSPAWR
jgi:acetoin utilization deacetylase AcuC-like enzyme